MFQRRTRIENLNTFKDHLHKTRNERAFYNKYRKDEDKSVQVISFNFMQTVDYPVNPQQPRSVYFKAVRKCFEFGITNEKKCRYYNPGCYET